MIAQNAQQITDYITVLNEQGYQVEVACFFGQLGDGFGHYASIGGRSPITDLLETETLDVSAIDPSRLDGFAQKYGIHPWKSKL